MRTWTRADRDLFCGYCVPLRKLPKGSPIVRIHLPLKQHDLIRCPHCADDPRPAWVQCELEEQEQIR